MVVQQIQKGSAYEAPRDCAGKVLAKFCYYQDGQKHGWIETTEPDVDAAQSVRARAQEIANERGTLLMFTALDYSNVTGAYDWDDPATHPQQVFAGSEGFSDWQVVAPWRDRVWR